MTLKPIDDRIIIRPLPADSTSAGGIHIPDVAKPRPMRGTVIAAGPGKRNRDGVRMELSIRVGDTVLFGRYSGSEITLNGEDAWLMREDEVLAIVEG